MLSMREASEVARLVEVRRAQRKDGVDVSEDIVTRLRGLACRVCAAEACMAHRGAADEIERLRTDLARSEHMAQLIYLTSERWHEMAEDLHEELAEWHAPKCPSLDLDAGACTCHTLIEARWTELVEGS